MQVFQGSGNLINAITTARKFRIIDHDGDSAYVSWWETFCNFFAIFCNFFQALEHDDVVVLQVPVFKVVEAFSEMREKQILETDK